MQIHTDFSDLESNFAGWCVLRNNNENIMCRLLMAVKSTVNSTTFESCSYVFLTLPCTCLAYNNITPSFLTPLFKCQLT